MIIKTFVSARTAVVFVVRIIDTAVVAKLGVGRTFAVTAFTRLVGKTRIATRAAVCRIAFEVCTRSPAGCFGNVVGIIVISVTTDFGRCACALDTRLCRITPRAAVAAVKRVVGEIDAQIEFFAQIGCRVSTDALTCALDA